MLMIRDKTSATEAKPLRCAKRDLTEESAPMKDDLQSRLAMNHEQYKTTPKRPEKFRLGAKSGG